MFDSEQIVRYRALSVMLTDNLIYYLSKFAPYAFQN